MKYIQEDGLIIKSWCDEPEEGAIKQAENLSKLPFAFHHIALMPDVHQGYGMPIGGVIATEGVVIVNAVGVDIGCFSGDTKIPLINGMQKTLKELYEEDSDVYVYSLDHALQLVVGKATPKLTTKQAEVMEVIISGGEVIRCTKEHKFMLLDGSYKEAQSLNIFDSLMPLYRSYEARDGYEHSKTSFGPSVVTHKMVAKQFLGEAKHAEIVHHKDEHWYNNDPINLEYKNKRLHSKEHRERNPVFGSEEFKKKRLLTLQQNGFFKPEYKAKKRQVAIQNISTYNKSAKKKSCDLLAGQRGRNFLIEYNKSKQGRLKSSEVGKKYGFGKTNHKVLFTRQIEAREDVFCLTVEKYHNFALSAGVFVHNCGMSAMKTSLTDITTEQLKKVLGGSKEHTGGIRSSIPTGFNKHSKKQSEMLMPTFSIGAYNDGIVNREYSNALHSLGTLGGGNHFIEIQKGSDGHIWAMVHSGSRNLGKQVCDYYNQKAWELNSKWFSSVPKNWDLAFLPLDDYLGQAYFSEMSYCVDFAKANRTLMMERIKIAFVLAMEDTIEFGDIMDVAHNYARMEHHFGRNVMVHRKGATSARDGEIGIIPGSQGTESYIVSGMGNPESFTSCSHGAGRRMSRTEACKTLNLDFEKELLDKRGILHAIRGEKDLDEASGAYKSITKVMEEQQDLVNIQVRLEPLAVVKG